MGSLSSADWVYIAIFVLMVVLGDLYVTYGSFEDDYDIMTVFVRENQIAGFFVYIILLLIGAFLPGPEFILIVGAGFCFESQAAAFFAAYLGTLFGAACSFFVGQKLLRDIFKRTIVDEYRYMANLDELMTTKAPVIVTLMRLSYIPFSKVTFLFACTGMSFIHYMAATAIGVLPATISMVILGSRLESFEHHAIIPNWVVAVAFLYTWLVLAVVALIAYRQYKNTAAARYEPVEESKGLLNDEDVVVAQDITVKQV